MLRVIRPEEGEESMVLRPASSRTDEAEGVLKNSLWSNLIRDETGEY
jgi:hypothetical protein